jgi:hypothetical protein
METADEWQLKLIHWQYFGTLTWRQTKLGSCKSREHDVEEFLRRWATREERKRDDLPSAIRWEKGEIGDRPHCHFLLAGFQSASLNTAYRQRAIWKTHYGLCRIRLFLGSAHRNSSVLYTVKSDPDTDRANRYETRKYATADRVVINEAAWRLMLAARSLAYTPMCRTA